MSVVDRKKAPATTRDWGVLRAYAVALVATGIAFLIRLALDPILGVQPVFALFVLAVMVPAIYGGIGPGLFATFWSVVLVYVFVLVPKDAGRSPRDAIEILLFVVTALGLMGLGHVLQTARRRAEAALVARSEAVQEVEARAAQLRSILATVPDAMVVIDERGTIEEFSPSAERLFGHTASEAVGCNVKMLMPAPYQERHDGYLAHYLETGERHIIGIGRIVTGRRKDGTTFPMELLVGEVRLEGRRIFTGFVRNLTERKNAERELATLQAELSHVARLSEMSQMGSTLAHELNQPLAAIINYLQACRRFLRNEPTPVSPRIEEAMEKAIAQADRAGQVIRRLREFVQKRETERGEEDLNAVVQDAVALALVGAQSAGVVSHINFDPTMPPVFIDKVQIQQVVLNLVRNAIESMAQSTRRLLTVDTRYENGEAQIRVADTGSGLAPNVAERLFEPFHSTKSSGMGIGLSICRSIVEAHGGRIWAARNPAGGTIFTFVLPPAALEESTDPS